MDTPRTGSAPSYILYDPERTDLTLTEADLEKFRSATDNHWKDFFLLSLPLGVSCLLNAVAGIPTPFALSLPLFLNYLIGGIALGLSIVFLVAWRKTRVDLDDVVARIKDRPKFRVEVGQTGTGATPAIVLRHENGAG